VEPLETIGPFSTVTANDPALKGARFYGIDDNGRKHEYMPPTIAPSVPQDYTTGGVPVESTAPPANAHNTLSRQMPYGQQIPYQQPQQHATPGTIQPMQSPYAVQQYQPMNQYPQFLNDPSFQHAQQQLANQAATNFLLQNQKPSKMDGARIFASKIAPVIGAVLGGGAVGGAMARQSRNAIIANRQLKQQQQQNAISSLNAVTNFVGTLGIRPLYQAAKAQNQAAQWNAGQVNKAANTGYVQGNQNQRQANSLGFQSWKYMDSAQRADSKFQIGQQFKNLGLAVDMDQFERTFDQKERFRKSFVDLMRFDRVMASQMHSDDVLLKRARLLQTLHQDAIKMELDVEQFNGKMQFELAKAQEAGGLPEGFDPSSVMLEFQNANTIKPEDIGLDGAKYQNFMDHLLTLDKTAFDDLPVGDLGQPMQQDPGLKAKAQSLGGNLQQQVAPQQFIPQTGAQMMTPPPLPQEIPYSIPTEQPNAQRLSALELTRQSQPIQRGSLLNAKSGQRIPPPPAAIPFPHTTPNGMILAPRATPPAQLTADLQAFMKSSGDIATAKRRILEQARRKGWSDAKAAQAVSRLEKLLVGNIARR